MSLIDVMALLALGFTLGGVATSGYYSLRKFPKFDFELTAPSHVVEWWETMDQADKTLLMVNFPFLYLRLARAVRATQVGGQR